MWASLIPAAAQTLQTAIHADAATANGMPASGTLSNGSGVGGMFGTFDNSGWTVSTGRASSNATTGDRGGQSAVSPGAFTSAAGGAPSMFSGAGAGMDSSTALLVVAAVVLGVVLLRGHK